jgi:hypothetical protein
MSAVEQASLHVPKSQLLWMVLGALLVATIIVVCFVLPAEFRIDPTGIGRATGVIRLAGAKTVSASEVQAPPDASGATGAAVRYYESGYRSDFVDIPLKSGEVGITGSELEYKVRMKAGGTIAYSWAVTGLDNPEEFYYDFHGEAPAKDQGAEATVVEYRQATGKDSSGTLVAPFDGVFGWYLQNQSVKPVVVRLKISGFYELVPPGEYGNDMGIEANKAVP